ncbi:MAG: LysE family translocator [Pseudomonadota bacterium]
MDFALYLAFLSTTLLFVAVPGPSAAFAAAQALRHGSRGALVTIAGDGLGTVIHILIAASSISVLVSLADFILPPLQIIGGLFVVYMGWRSLTAPRRPAQASDTATFWAGFFTCVSNPKAIVFFVALFPAFIAPEGSILLQSLILGLTFLVLDALSLTAFALLSLCTVRQARTRWLDPHKIAALGLFGVGAAMVAKGVRALPQD